MLRFRTALLPSLMIVAGLVAAFPASPIVSASVWADEEEGDGIDRIVLRNGRVIEGQILSESDTQIEVLVMVGGISAPTTYPKSDVLSIERDVKVVTTTTAPKTATNRPTTTPKDTTSTKSSVGDGPRVYLMTLEGDLGSDITKTPLSRAFEDALSHDPEVIIVKLDAGSGIEGFDGLWTAEELGPIIEDLIDAGHRVVFWVERAESGAAFLPLVSPEIYFTSEGTLGGVGDLSEFNIGDKVVNLKQISLRLGHAEGFAIKGGYEPKLIRAMAIKEDWLAYRLRGGQPEYITWEPRPEDGDGWIVLTDDGKGKNKDKYAFNGNDVLTLDADLAFRLHVAKDVIDSLDDLIFDLNIGRDHVVVEGRADQILKEWRDNVERAEDQIRRLQEEFADAGRGRGRDASAKLGRQMNILRQIRGVLSAYEEVFDVSGQQRAQIDVQIEELRQQIRRANERR